MLQLLTSVKHCWRWNDYDSFAYKTNKTERLVMHIHFILQIFFRFFSIIIFFPFESDALIMTRMFLLWAIQLAISIREDVSFCCWWCCCCIVVVISLIVCTWYALEIHSNTHRKTQFQMITRDISYFFSFFFRFCILCCEFTVRSSRKRAI